MKKLGEKSCGIYYFMINDLIYVGKDRDINRQKRIKEHLNHLSKNKHYNFPMQKDYNEGGLVKYGVIVDFKKQIDDSFLCECEEYWIKKLESYNNGYNKTTGGLGGSGIKYTASQLESKSLRVTGDKNPMSKLSLPNFLEIVSMFKENKSNKEIAEKFNLHDRYVSLIRNKRRYKRWFEEYASDYEIISGVQFQATSKKLTNKDTAEIYDIIINTNLKNVEIAKLYSVDPSTISRLRTKIKKGEEYI